MKPLLGALQSLLITFLTFRVGHALQPELSDSDLVQVRASCAARLELAHATGRAARATTALRTVYVLENETLVKYLQERFANTMNETYLYWPDRPDPKKPGDSRVAMAPWLAHKAMGNSYKWFLYGDDDTLFFSDSVKRLLRDYDPNMPYVLTDMLWHKRKRQLSEAPRCLPCHVTPTFREAVAVRPDLDSPRLRPGEKTPVFHGALVPPAGCPCTPELACEYTLNVTGKRKFLQRPTPVTWSPESAAWGFPRGYPSKCDYPHFHGGSGVLVSVGAMRKVSYDAALECYYDDVVDRTAKQDTLKALAHGDRMTSLCFWLHGIAITDPGLSLSNHSTTNVATRVMDNRAANLKTLQAAAEGSVARNYLWSILNMAAVHVGHQAGAVELAWQMAKLYPAARRTAEITLRQLGMWGRGDLDAQVVPEGLRWDKGWKIKGTGEAVMTDDTSGSDLETGSG